MDIEIKWFFLNYFVRYVKMRKNILSFSSVKVDGCFVFLLGAKWALSIAVSNICFLCSLLWSKSLHWQVRKGSKRVSLSPGTNLWCAYSYSSCS